MHGRPIPFLILFASLLLTAFCSSAITGNCAVFGYGPGQVAGNTYNIVSQPTDQWGLFVTTTPLPADYDQTTITPITKYDFQIQQNLQALEMTAIILATVATDTEEAAPELLSADEAGAANTFFHYTQAEIPAGQGLNINSGVTTVGNMNASEAMFNLGIDKPTYVYPVTLENPADYLIQDLGIPARNQIPSWRVIQQTPPGSVGMPTPVPPAP
jgi:hypothetical protein